MLRSVCVVGKRETLFIEKSPYRVRANIPPLAFPAFAAAPHLVEFLNVGSANPQAALGLRRKVQDSGVVGRVGDEGGGHGEWRIEN